MHAELYFLNDVNCLMHYAYSFLWSFFVRANVGSIIHSYSFLFILVEFFLGQTSAQLFILIHSYSFLFILIHSYSFLWSFFLGQTSALLLMTVGVYSYLLCCHDPNFFIWYKCTRCTHCLACICIWCCFTRGVWSHQTCFIPFY